jgi:hypothetical protein
MKHIAGLSVLLLLAGCVAPVSVAAPVAPATSAAPSPSGTVQVRPESLLKLPLGTVVDLDTQTVVVLADEGIRTTAGKSLWAVRVKTCISADYMETRTVAQSTWWASTAAGGRLASAIVRGADSYGDKALSPGECDEGLIYFASGAHPARVWHMSTTAGYIGWTTTP